MHSAQLHAPFVPAHEAAREEDSGLPAGPGVAFPLIGARRTTTATGRAILGDAAAAVSGDLGRRIRSGGNWRDEYLGVLRELTIASAERKSSLAIARAGLATMRTQLTFEREDRAVSLDGSLEAIEPSLELGTGEVRGSAPAVTQLRVPYRGRQLEGGALARQLERWSDAGVVEPSFAEAVNRVAEHPEWLSLPGREVALVGAGAEIGPLEALCSWGAEVIAIDLPRPEVWERIGELARGGAGVVRMPLRADRSAGVDVTRMLPETRAWIERATRADELVLGMYAYADGGDHVRATGAFDVLATEALRRRPSTTVSFLATPTDAFVVPDEVVARSGAAYRGRGIRGVLQAPAKGLSGKRLFAAAYRDGVPVADALVKQQGPNYAIAKRLQRWRGVVANAEGHRVSFNVAPPTRTHSVTKNRVLAAAYAGAHHFGVEIFEPSTTRVLMAALLVHDLNRPSSPEEEPERLFSGAAAHGGLWSAAYEPRSVLGIAALAGLPRAAFAGRRTPA
jgi:hypothetical protein